MNIIEGEPGLFAQLIMYILEKYDSWKEKRAKNNSHSITGEQQYGR